jgi:hypothetical protein
VSIAPLNLKVGLCNSVDFQLVIETSPPSARARHCKRCGAGRVLATSLTTKWNIWGSDGGATALALMPFVKLPTNQDDLGNNSVEGGLIVPLRRNCADLNVGLMTELASITIPSGRSSRRIRPLDHLCHEIEQARRLVGSSAVSAETGSDWVERLTLGSLTRIG